MRNFRTGTLVSLLGLGLALTGCNGGNLDDPDNANSVMEVNTTTITSPTLSGDLSDDTCRITITNATSSLKNLARNAPGEGEPFNDIVVQKVIIKYTWDDPALVTPTRTFDLGATIPAGGSVSVQYPPIGLGDVIPSMVGHTVNMEMLFVGTAVSGEVVTADGGGAMGIGGSCTP